MIELRGTGVAIITPFTQDGSVDHNSLEALVENLIQNEIEYLVVLGTTGESVTLDAGEKRAVLDTVIKTNNKRIPVVAGFGGNNTAAIIADLQNYDLNGVDAILSVSPYYNKPSQEGIYQHYMAVAQASPLPMVIYNVPGRTSSNISAETTLRLARDAENIIAVKEASGDLVQCMNIVADRPDGFLVISGDDILTQPMLAMGMDGVTSVVANAYPKEFSDMVRAGLNGDASSSMEPHYRLTKMIDLLFAEGSPGGIKAALHAMGRCENILRLPLVPVSEAHYSKIKSEVENLQVPKPFLKGEST